MANLSSPAFAPTRRADGVAVLLSALCLVHCLALPLLAAFAPVITVLSENEAVHKVLVLAVAPITFWVVWSARAERDFRSFLVLAVVGVMLLCVGAFVPPLEAYEVILTVIGASMLGVAHWRRLSAQGSTHEAAQGEGDG